VGFFVWLFLVVQEFELRALHLLDRCFTTRAAPPARTLKIKISEVQVFRVKRKLPISTGG
jgi:hypothetical protein